MKRILIYIFLLSLLTACGNSIEERERMTRAERARLHTEDSLALKLAVMPTADCLPLFVAKEKRLFDTLGVDVRLRVFSAQMDCDTAFEGGSVEGAVSDVFRMKRMAAKGVKLEYLSATNAYWQLIANRRARLKNVSQFGDKMIAMTRFSATDYLCDHVLKGVKTSSVVFRIQVNDVNVRMKMLLNNEMDAAWLPEPYATEARLQGNVVVSDSRDLKRSLGVIALRKEVKADARRRKQVEAFVKAYDMACDSIAKYGMANYRDVLRKYYKVDDKTLRQFPKIRFSHISKPQTKDLELADAKF